MQALYSSKLALGNNGLVTLPSDNNTGNGLPSGTMNAAELCTSPKEFLSRKKGHF